MHFDKKQIPNLITTVRIIGSVCLLFTKSFSPAFFVIYTVCGISDVVDGTVARLMKCESDIGSKLDSIADLIFYGGMFLAILPLLIEEIPLLLWIGAFSVIFIRICSYTLAAVKYHRFASIHSYANKLTGASVFCIPYFSIWFGVTPICTVVFVISLFASVEELLIHIISKKYNSNVKSIFCLAKIEKSEEQNG